MRWPTGLGFVNRPGPSKKRKVSPLIIIDWVKGTDHKLILRDLGDTELAQYALGTIIAAGRIDQINGLADGERLGRPLVAG